MVEGWHQRIPSAIKEAEEHVAGCECCQEASHQCSAVPYTATEVMLAEALWKYTDSFGAWATAEDPKTQEWSYPALAALRKFTEKVDRR